MSRGGSEISPIYAQPRPTVSTKTAGEEQGSFPPHGKSTGLFYGGLYHPIPLLEKYQYERIDG
jgi:hypothetical protein